MAVAFDGAMRGYFKVVAAKESSSAVREEIALEAFRQLGRKDMGIIFKVAQLMRDMGDDIDKVCDELERTLT